MRSISRPFVVARPAGTRIKTRPANRRVRWAGSITRTANDQWQRAHANLADRRIALLHAVCAIRMRLAVPVGQRQGRLRGDASQAERFAKLGRLQHLQAELAEVEGRLATRRVSVCRGGRRLAKQRHTLDQAKLTEQQWRARWQAERLSLTADGDAEYLDASWRLPSVTPPSLEERRRYRALGVDLNAGHLDAWVLDTGGNPVGSPHTIPLDLDGQTVACRDGRLRAAISAIFRLATDGGCRSILVENLNFADAATPAGRPWGGAGAANPSAE